MGQFKELVLSAERDQPLQEHLRKVLNLTAKGWEEAARHALRAVSTDNRMRMWLADDAASTGLLFRCARGRIALDAPVGAPADTCVGPAGLFLAINRFQLFPLLLFRCPRGRIALGTPVGAPALAQCYIQRF